MGKYKHSLLCLLLVLMFSACGQGGTSAGKGFIPKYEFDTPSEGYVTVARDGTAVLELNSGTLDFRFSKDGLTWESLSFSDEDPDLENAEYDSLFVLKGSTSGGTDFVLDSFAACISRGQYEIKQGNNKLTAVFTVGDLNPRIILPEIIREEILEKQILSNLSDREKNRFLKRYNFLSLEEAESDEERANLEKAYPFLKEGNAYVLSSDVTEREKKQLEGYAASVGYTEEMLDAEYKALQFSEDESSESPVFEVTVIFSLENGDFIAEIPQDGIKYNTKKFVLNIIDFMKNIAASPAEDANEIFIPDGSGAVIDLAGADAPSGKITKTVYGAEDYLDGDTNQKDALFPVFGFSGKQGTLFAVIESGDPLGQITADYAGKNASVYAGFEYQAQYLQSTLDGWQNIRINGYNPVPPDTALRVRYTLLSKGASYPEMATVYREYLEKSGILKSGADEILPFYAETLGSVNADGRFLFFPTNSLVALTTYEQNLDIIKALEDNGVKNIQLRLTGAVNGGMENTLSDKIDFLSVLGGKKGWKKLLSESEKYGADVYINLEYGKVYKDKSFDGFHLRRDAARGLDDKYSLSGAWNAATKSFVQESVAYRLSADKLAAAAKKSISKNSSENVGISAGSIGESVAPNYVKGGVVNRNESVAAYVSALEAISGSHRLMVSGGNAYVLPYARHILNIPPRSSLYTDYADSVPFVQMVLHGSVNYAAQAINREDDMDIAVLRCIETGSAVHVVLSAENAPVLRGTPFSYYLSSDSEIWIKRAAEAYKTVSDALKGVTGLKITEHRRVDLNVTETTYEDGTKIFVNYGDEDFKENDIIVSARGYAVTSDNNIYTKGGGK